MADERVTIREAATRLGVSEGAVRKRVDRGSLRSEKGDDGKVYVFLPGGEDTSTTPESNALTSRMEDEITYLRAELDKRSEEIGRRDAIIMQLSQANAEMSRTIRAIEAPTSSERPPDGPESAEPRSDRVETPREPDTGTQRRSLWGRLFGR